MFPPYQSTEIDFALVNKAKQSSVACCRERERESLLFPVVKEELKPPDHHPMIITCRLNVKLFSVS